VPNVFNSVLRGVIFQELHAASGDIIQLIPFVRVFYVFESPLFYNHHNHENDVISIPFAILQLQVSLDVCAHILLTLWVSTFYVTFMVMNALEPMMEFTIPLPPLHETLTSMWDKNNYMHFLQPHSTHFINKSTLCFPKMAFAP